MADRGFAIRDVLEELNISLNIPPFMERHQQLPSDEVKTGRKIASLRIHVERAIGRMKNYGILKSTIPISPARFTNQIVHVCTYLTNFQPALVPLPEDCSENEVDSYFNQMSECGTEDSEVDSEVE